MSSTFNHLSRCCLALAVLAAPVGCGSAEETSGPLVPSGGPADPAVGDCPVKGPVLACGQPHPVGIAVDAKNVYYGVDGAIMKVPIHGGDAVAVVRLTMPASAIAVHGGEVFWIDHDTSATFGGSVHKVKIEGGIPVLIATSESEPTALAVDDESVYWTEEGAVMKAPTAGGGAPTMLAPAHWPVAIAVNGANAYWTEIQSTDVPNSQDGRVMRVPLQGGPAVAIASDQSHPVGIALDATNLYWATEGTMHGIFTALGDGAVNRMALAGDTSIVTLLQGDASDLSTRNAPTQIALTADSVYWLDSLDGTVGKLSIAGGAPETVSEGKKSQREIAAGPKRVYVLDATENTVIGIDQ
jgi:hypothetical protein